MSLLTVARELVELCNQGRNFDAMRTLYAPEIVSVEGDGAETAGQAPVIRKSEVWQTNNQIHAQTLRGPFFHGDSRFAIHFLHDVTPRATGRRVTREEVAVYTVGDDDKITREQFFYDGER
jgi:hypothetical protein